MHLFRLEQTGLEEAVPAQGRGVELDELSAHSNPNHSVSPWKEEDHGLV